MKMNWPGADWRGTNSNEGAAGGGGSHRGRQRVLGAEGLPLALPQRWLTPQAEGTWALEPISPRTREAVPSNQDWGGWRPGGQVLPLCASLGTPGRRERTFLHDAARDRQSWEGPALVSAQPLTHIRSTAVFMLVEAQLQCGQRWRLASPSPCLSGAVRGQGVRGPRGAGAEAGRLCPRMSPELAASAARSPLVSPRQLLPVPKSVTGAVGDQRHSRRGHVTSRAGREGQLAPFLRTVCAQRACQGFVAPAPGPEGPWSPFPGAVPAAESLDVASPGS